MREQIRNTEVQTDEGETGKLPENEFRMMTVKIVKSLDNKMEKMRESINQDLGELKNKHRETNNTVADTETAPEGINRMSEAEE